MRPTTPDALLRSLDAMDAVMKKGGLKQLRSFSDCSKGVYTTEA